MTTAATNPLAILTFDNTWLALPLAEVTVVERTAEVRHGDVHGRALGRLVRAGRRYAVYGFSPSLRLLPELPARHPFCACLAGQEGQPGVAVTCDTVTPVNLGQDAVLQSLPECMRRTRYSLRYLLKRQQWLVPVSTAAALMHYIANLEKEIDEYAQ
ncbi:MAG: hypothetical protein MZU95_05475 [Desulfomicrobium escambiense]|nr:hypothetical protein [Desulfomicrobium escambiense]